MDARAGVAESPHRLARLRIVGIGAGLADQLADRAFLAILGHASWRFPLAGQHRLRHLQFRRRGAVGIGADPG